MSVVYGVVSPCGELVLLFSNKDKAIEMAEGYSDQFTVRAYTTDNEEANCGYLVWCRGLTENQIAEANLIASKRYVRMPPRDYAAILRKLLKNRPEFTVEEVARRINKPVKYITDLLENNPEPHIPVAEGHKDETLDDRGKLAQQHPADWSGTGGPRD